MPDDTSASAALASHEWVAPYSAASDLCGALVMRDGGGDECGLPRAHVVHRRATPCMDDCCRMAGGCAWECGGRYYVPSIDSED